MKQLTIMDQHYVTFTSTCIHTIISGGLEKKKEKEED